MLLDNSSGRDLRRISLFNDALQQLVQTVNKALPYLQSHTSNIPRDHTPSEAQRLANPDVVHADFSTFRGYQNSGWGLVLRG